MVIVTLVGGLLLALALLALASWLWFADPQWGRPMPASPAVEHPPEGSSSSAVPVVAAVAPPPPPVPAEGSTEIFDPAIFTMPAAAEGGGDKTQIISDMVMPGFPPHHE